MPQLSWLSTNRRILCLFCVGVLFSGLPLAPAFAFDLFGWFRGSSDAPPAPSADALPYSLDIVIGGDNDDLEQTIKDASTLQSLQSDPPPDSAALISRAQADLPRLIDALWGAGFYNARVTINVAGVPMVLQAPRTEAAIRAAAGYRSRALVPIQIVADPGPQFALRDVNVFDARTRLAYTPSELPPRVVQIKPGDPARSADILAAEARIVDYFRAQSRPFAKIQRQDPVVYHQAQVMDVGLGVDPGPKAGIGAITIQGAEGVDPAVVRSFIYTEPGDPYSPATLASMRKSISQIEALGSVRIREAEVLDAYGNLPLFVELTERPLRVIGASAQYSTTDGPALRAYWAHRNLFGGAERLRLEGSVFYLTEDGGQPDRDEGWNWDDLGGRFRASFLKPALWGTRNDLLVDGLAERDRTEGYTSRFVNVTAGIRHRFSETFSIQGGIEYERGQSTDILGSDRLYAGRPAGVPELRFHRRPPQSHEGDPGACLGGAISGGPRLLGPDHDRQGHGLDLFLPRRGGPLRARRPHRSGFHRRRGPRRDSGQSAFLRRRRRLRARLSLPEPQPDLPRAADRRPEPAGGLHRGTHQDHRHHRHRALRRCRHGLRVELSGLRRAASASPRVSACAIIRPSAPFAWMSPIPSIRDPAIPPTPSTSESGRPSDEQANPLPRPSVACRSRSRSSPSGCWSGRPSQAQSDQGILASLISRLLSTPTTRVTIGSIEGALSSNAVIRDIRIADKDGVWLNLDRARLVWSRTALLRGRLQVDELTIDRLQILRRPLPAEEDGACLRRADPARTAGPGDRRPLCPAGTGPRRAGARHRRRGSRRKAPPSSATRPRGSI